MTTLRPPAFPALPASLPASLLILTALTGCAASPTPWRDAHFGEAVQAARQAQTIHLVAPEVPPEGIDGEAATAIMDGYHESYRTPPKTTDTSHIGER